MKVLYAIQATGNGHLSRATEIIPLLKKKCDVDILVSGTEADVALGHEIKYRTKGLCFVFGKKGGVDMYATLKKMHSKRFLNEIKNFPVEDYDLVINDFEPVTAWACRKKNVPCVAMSHQFAVLHKNAPRPVTTDALALMILRYYAPCKEGVGFHFKSYGNNIFTPVIRKAIRDAHVTNEGHYTVYLPAYHEKKLIAFFSAFKNTRWHIFSKHTRKAFVEKNCWVRPVDGESFAESFTSCEGIVSGGGFETPAEALFMGKKLLVVPMKNQYEQQCNAEAAKEEFGVPVIKSLKKKHLDKVGKWLESEQNIKVDFADETDKIIEMLLAQHLPALKKSKFPKNQSRLVDLPNGLMPKAM